MSDHIHSYTFNDDGFEVCITCGICTTLRELKHDSYLKTITNEFYSTFSNILLNNNIGYIYEIEHEYNQIKHKLMRGYPNIVLYAYSAYNTLLKNGVYYSLNHISNIFQINDFSKQFCHIQRNYSIEKRYFNIKQDKYIFSSLTLFLSEMYLLSYFGRAVKFSKLMEEYHPRMKANCHLSVSLYFTLQSVFKIKQELLKKLSLYYSINIRTLNKTIKYVENETKINDMI